MSEAIILPQFIPPAPDLSGYALLNHTHSNYAASSHSHSGYASSTHSHSGYATQTWVTENFATKGSGGESSNRQVITVKITGSATVGSHEMKIDGELLTSSRNMQPYQCNKTISSASLTSVTGTATYWQDPNGTPICTTRLPMAISSHISQPTYCVLLQSTGHNIGASHNYISIGADWYTNQNVFYVGLFQTCGEGYGLKGVCDLTLTFQINF